MKIFKTSEIDLSSLCTNIFIVLEQTELQIVRRFGDLFDVLTQDISVP